MTHKPEGQLADGRPGPATRAVALLKYVVYLLLAFNVYLFLREELLALEHTFVDGFEPSQVIQVFSATIDTAAWVCLLLLFELETAVLDDRKIRGAVKWGLHGVRLFCYVAVCYAFFGYCAELATLYDASLVAGFDACAAEGLSVMVRLDTYVPLDQGNCSLLGAEVYRLNGFSIVAQPDVFELARRLAWLDVINSAAWLLVVALLEVEVRLQLRGDLSTAILDATRWFKFALYGTLFAAAAYWGVAGDFLDFWDAILWLFAFIFIERNILAWQAQTSQLDRAVN